MPKNVSSGVTVRVCSHALCTLASVPQFAAHLLLVVGLARVSQSAHSRPDSLHGKGRAKGRGIAALAQNPRHKAFQRHGQDKHREGAVIVSREALRTVGHIEGGELPPRLVETDCHVIDPLVVKELVRRDRGDEIAVGHEVLKKTQRTHFFLRKRQDLSLGMSYINYKR